VSKVWPVCPVGMQALYSYTLCVWGRTRLVVQCTTVLLICCLSDLVAMTHVTGHRGPGFLKSAPIPHIPVNLVCRIHQLSSSVKFWTNVVCICSPIQAQVSDSLLPSEQVGWCGLTQLDCGIQINLVSNFHHVTLDYNYEHCRWQVMLMPPNCQIGTNLVNNCPPAFK
jgi:hypothetical protein